MPFRSRWHRLGLGDDWYRITLDETCAKARDMECVRQRFERACACRAYPEGMALWFERGAARGDCLYLSPAAVASEPGLVHDFNAVRCPRPTGQLELISGGSTHDSG